MTIYDSSCELLRDVPYSRYFIVWIIPLFGLREFSLNRMKTYFFQVRGNLQIIKLDLQLIGKILALV